LAYGLAAQRSRFAAPHAQRSKLKASDNNALLGIAEFMCSCISLERSILIPNLQHLSKVHRQECGD
jgi:hypothetical protein